MENLIPLLARILLSALFIQAGINHLLDPVGTQQYMASKGMPLTGLFFIGAVSLLLAGGLSLLVGWKGRWAAIALIIFLIPATLIFHTDFSNQMQITQFMKNLAILGGLLMVVQYGPGPFSIDARNRRGFRGFSRY